MQEKIGARILMIGLAEGFEGGMITRLIAPEMRVEKTIMHGAGLGNKDLIKLSHQILKSSWMQNICLVLAKKRSLVQEKIEAGVLMIGLAQGLQGGMRVEKTIMHRTGKTIMHIAGLGNKELVKLRHRIMRSSWMQIASPALAKKRNLIQEKDSSRRSHDRSSPRVTWRNDDETNRGRDEGRKDNYARRGFREQGFDKAKPPDKQKLLEAKRVSSVSQEEKSDAGKDRSKPSYDRSSPRVTGRNDDETNCGRDEGRKDNYARSGVRQQRVDKAKTPHNQKLLDLIDLIPMTKDGVFSYKINWAVYDKNKLHD